ncbi:UNVERIFIED_CONTAM: hypothetical protein FKN15_076783 [Acipenser sinensis]
MNFAEYGYVVDRKLDDPTDTETLFVERSMALINDYCQERYFNHALINDYCQERYFNHVSAANEALKKNGNDPVFIFFRAYGILMEDRIKKPFENWKLLKAIRRCLSAP